MKWLQLKLRFVVVVLLIVFMCLGLSVQGQNIVFIDDDDVSSEDNDCHTHNGGRGECIDIRNCPILLSLVFKSNQHEFLRQSQCGWIDNIPKVCCDTNWNCTTPDNEPGYCVELTSCAVINLTETSTDSQDNITCGFDNIDKSSKIYECCTSLLQESHDQVTKPTTTQPPNNGHCEMTSVLPGPLSKCCGRDVGANRIIGGEATTIDQYPWSAAIEYQKGDIIKIKCGGTLISGTYIVTAAHCVSDKAWRPVSVRLGDYDIDHPGLDCVEVEGGGEDCTDEPVVMPIEKTFSYPYYNSSSRDQAHDIALIKLQGIVPYTDFIRPICLPTTDIAEKAADKLTLTVAGWGAHDDIHSYSPIKRHVDVPFVSQENCFGVYQRARIYLREGQICAGGEKGKDSCKGDSGGGLMLIQDSVTEIVGITSFGYTPCGEENKPAIYTKVYRYLPWIRRIISEELLIDEN